MSKISENWYLGSSYIETIGCRRPAHKKGFFILRNTLIFMLVSVCCAFTPNLANWILCLMWSGGGRSENRNENICLLFFCFCFDFFSVCFPSKWFICLMTLEWRWQVGKPQPKSVPAARDSQTRRLSGSAFSSQENRNFFLLFLGSNIFPWIGSLICNLTSCYLRVGWRYQNG